ncbi:DUF3027 domain-containing protein [Kocuria sp.]|uniref:DUF3027 domain-containing protein n=1 Tax=Kocuria sp. TaxID=1871328 RepID=UPI0026DCAB97|nr:DUF3027 domain-containing protein [Kocuria sp.]MDO4919299.1 DUF3027 domain-containing protein [Kocuria sp.]
MSEPTTDQDGTAAGAPAPAPRRRTSTRARTRTPKQDPVLSAAVALAREAVLLGGQDESGVGDHVGVRVHEDRLLTHLFECRLRGYPGWTWYATVARAPRSKHVTVCESGLLAGPDSLLAPAWVPWEERMQAVREQEGEGSPDAESSPAPDADPARDAGSQAPAPETPAPEGPVDAAVAFSGGDASS